ncbi:hypothetical protein MMC20_007315 [Loxospora ochrophaea]|nr:hypothetical protein [Loxospora ochrophaea]
MDPVAATKESGGQGNKKAESSSKSQRLLRVDQIYSRKDRQIHYVKTAKSSLNQAKYDRFNKTVLVVRRIISKQGMVAGTEVDVKSTQLRDVLLEIFEGVEGLQLNKTPPMVDPKLLFYALPSLTARINDEEAKDTPNKGLIDDISTALEFIDEDFGNTILSLASLSEHDEITFDLLWTLFPPRTVVFTKKNEMNEPQALRFQTGSYETRQDRSEYFSLKCSMINHDGQDFGWGDHWLEINGFEGAKKTYTLSALPLSLHPEKEAMRNQLIDRGRKYIQMLEPTCREYNGTAIRSNPNDGKPFLKLNAKGRIMVDPVAYRQQNPNSNILQPWVPVTISPERLKDDDLLMCSHWLLGFSFVKKTWAAFAISKMSDVIWNEGAFQKLVINPKRRDLIHSLVKSHQNDGETFDDFVQDKGKGLVGLLSGNPGVGKTLTAEVVSEVTKRPLYMVTAGELGTDVSLVDQHLEMVLEITRRWGCVLLIDEADVFLQARDAAVDLKRNALVSIFLRRLEYFQGILIMTTNRKHSIDAAFQSRIHFKLHYSDLTESSRATIWRQFFSSIPAGVTAPNFTGDEITELAKMPLNGRQIKNAVSCSLSISREDKIPLTIERIQTILGIVVDGVDNDD